MPTLGIYGPKHPEHSGVANYIELTLKGLGRFFECYHVDNNDWSPPDLFDYVLYHVGGSSKHLAVFRALGLRRGPAIIHEHNCLSFYYEAWPSLTDDARANFLKHVSKVLSKEFCDLNELYAFLDRHPIYDRWSAEVFSESFFMDNVTIAITHSPIVRDLLRGRYPSSIVETLPYPVRPFNPKNSSWARQVLGLKSKDFLFGSFGFIGQYKRVEKIIEAWMAWQDRPPWVKLLILGERQYPIQIPVSSNLVYIDYVDNEDIFDAYLGALDCAIQLRYPTLGETSSVVSKMLANSRPVIISKTEYTAHYEQNQCMIQVCPDENEVLNLVASFRQLIQQPRFPSRHLWWHSPEVFTKQISDLILATKKDLAQEQ